MINVYDIDSKIKSRNIEDLINKPEIVYVNEFDDGSFKEFQENFQAALDTNQSIIPIIIDSYGGEVYTVLAMIDLIRSAKVSVATIGVGKAMSAGSLLLSAGTRGMRYASPSCSIMIHELHEFIGGKNNDVQTTAKETKRINDYLLQVLDKNSSRSDGYYKDLLEKVHNADLYMSPYQAKEHGLIDHVGIPALEIKINVETFLK